MDELMFQLFNFSGGINEYIDDMNLNYNESPYLKNVEVSDSSLQSSKSPIVFLETNLGENIVKLMTYYNNTQKYLLVVTQSGKVYKYNNNTFSLITTLNNTEIDYINFQHNGQDVIVFGNGVDYTKVYDGTNVIDLKKDGGNSTPSSTNKAPKTKFFTLHMERLWCAGDSENPNRVYFSKDFDIHDFTTPLEEGEANMHGGFIDIPTWDGGKITALHVLFNDVIVFKTKNIFRVFGTNPSNYTIHMLYASDSAIADKSIVQHNSAVYFASRDGILVFDGTNVKKISQKIDKTWEKLNKQCLDKAIGIVYKNKYILAVPYENSTVNNFIIEYDLNSGAFVLKDNIVINDMLDFDTALLFTKNNTNIYEYNAINSNIHSEWHSKLLDFKTPNAKKVFSHFYVIATGDENNKIRITIDTERGQKYVDIKLTPNKKIQKYKLKNKGRLVKIKIDNLNNPFALYRLAFVYELDED